MYILYYICTWARDLRHIYIDRWLYSLSLSEIVLLCVVYIYSCTRTVIQINHSAFLFFSFLLGCLKKTFRENVDERGQLRRKNNISGARHDSPDYHRLFYPQIFFCGTFTSEGVSEVDDDDDDGVLGPYV